MNYQALYQNIKSKKSYLCVGLDTDLSKIPPHLLSEEDPIFEFNKQIIDATYPFAVAYKPNTAFYEALGARGWESLQKTIDYLPKDTFNIADAKRGDIGNTSAMYAKAFFERMNFDAVTVAPYMGEDSVKPFLDFNGKWVILLALTSNTGSQDFEQLSLQKGDLLFEEVIKKSQTWADETQMMYVVGATKAEKLQEIRLLAPEHFLLVPGVGAQGGSLEEVSKYGLNSHVGLLVNSSREILYASNDKDFAKKSAERAESLQSQMARFLDKL
ncbi:MAG: orotidine-5'-phosphate decarboxylase [Raineya sp.]|jgi:orotidine-5'-phosphate decarboxylase|nr:orotidine-5'-phosphate decarboxylase [Raineya sp.]